MARCFRGEVPSAGDERLRAGERRGGMILENRHTGEQLAMRRLRRGDEVWLELKGSLPPQRQGPPLHVHFAEDEEGYVRSGTLSVLLDGRLLSVGPGESTSIARGRAHRWWNEGDEPLVFEGYARPVVDLDRYLQAIFEVLNAAAKGGLPFSTSLMPPCGTATPSRCSSCPGRFRPFCFEWWSPSAPCWAAIAATTGPGVHPVVSARRWLLNRMCNAGQL
jgi:mannose-6-phosphate isomerase-like protein (cupin superfamily)